MKNKIVVTIDDSFSPLHGVYVFDNEKDLEEHFYTKEYSVKYCNLECNTLMLKHASFSAEETHKVYWAKHY